MSTLTNGKTYTCTVHATNAVGNSARIGRVGVDRSRDHARRVPAQPTVTRGDAPDLGRVRGARQRRQHDHGLHRERARRATAGRSERTRAERRRSWSTASPTARPTPAPCRRPTPKAPAPRRPRRPPRCPASCRPRPRQPTVTHGNAPISVAFSAPASDGGSAITGYTATCTSSDGGTTGSNSGATSPRRRDHLDQRQDLYLHRVRVERNGAGNRRSPRRRRFLPPRRARPPQPTLTHGNASISVAFTRRRATAAARSPVTPPPARRATAARRIEHRRDVADLVSALTNGKTYTCTVTRDQRRRQRLELRRLGIDRPRNHPEHAGHADDLAAAAPRSTVTFVAPAQRWQRDHRLHRELHVDDGGTAGIEHRRAPRRSSCRASRSARPTPAPFTRPTPKATAPSRRRRSARRSRRSFPDAPAQPTRDPRQRVDLGRVRRAGATAAARSPATRRPARRATAAPPGPTPVRPSPILVSVA